MTREIETKILDIDEEKVKKTLSVLGAKKTRETRFKVDWYGPKGIKEGEDPWFLRIRSDSDGKHEVTWKSVIEILGAARKCEEINFFVEEPRKLAGLFIELGLKKYAHQEKNRTSFTLKSCNFDIDKYPNMPAYLEIEGESEKAVIKAVELLDLGGHRTWKDGERTLIQKIYGLDWYNMRF